MWALAPDEPARAPALVWDRDYEDAYNDPGAPMARRTELGTYVIARLEGCGELLLQGAQALALLAGYVCPWLESHESTCFATIFWLIQG